jgi:hypothetical protein
VVAAFEKEKIERIKKQWKLLWQEKLDDKLRAEGMAIRDYSAIFVEKGTIIYATRNFKFLTIREILKQHQILDAERYVPIDPQTGGLTKFIKTRITNRSSWRKKEAKVILGKTHERQQRKKSGRGWLNK